MSSEEAWTKYRLSSRCWKITPPKNRPFTASWFWTKTESHPQVCCTIMQGTQHAESVERQSVGKGMVCSLRWNPGLTLRKAENLSYGRLRVFSREPLHDFLEILWKTMDSMKLH
jgi:hypothetical protein